MGVLVTGAAGFIGSHVTQALLARGQTVVGLDNLNAYYAPQRKRANLVNCSLLLALQAKGRDVPIPTGCPLERIAW